MQPTKAKASTSTQADVHYVLDSDEQIELEQLMEECDDDNSEEEDDEPSIPDNDEEDDEDVLDITSSPEPKQGKVFVTKPPTE